MGCDCVLCDWLILMSYFYLFVCVMCMWLFDSYVICRCSVDVVGVC